MFTYLTAWLILFIPLGGGGVLETPNWVPGVHDKVPLKIGGPFWILDETMGYDLWPNFWPLILRPLGLLTSIDGGW